MVSVTSASRYTLSSALSKQILDAWSDSTDFAALAETVPIVLDLVINKISFDVWEQRLEDPGEDEDRVRFCWSPVSKSHAIAHFRVVWRYNPMQ